MRAVKGVKCASTEKCETDASIKLKGRNYHEYYNTYYSHRRAVLGVRRRRRLLLDETTVGLTKTGDTYICDKRGVSTWDSYGESKSEQKDLFRSRQRLAMKERITVLWWPELRKVSSKLPCSHFLWFSTCHIRSKENAMRDCKIRMMGSKFLLPYCPGKIRKRAGTAKNINKGI